MKECQFRFGYFTPKYEATIAFYRDGLEFPIVEAWDRTADDLGTLFGAASGIIEVVALPPSGQSDHLWDKRSAQGAFMVIEMENLAALYQRAIAKGLPIQQELKNQEWGHRSFCLQEPNGLTLYFFSEIQNLQP
jgi:catechol 2,3-dioxygenase-like lactoylglutathione lyase family enzyme